MNYDRIFTYMSYAAIALLLIGFSGWYFFIQGKTASVKDAAAARGYSIGIPSFLGNRGSTAELNDASVQSGAQTNTGTAVSPRKQSVGSAFLQFLGIGEGELAPTDSPTGVPTDSSGPDGFAEKKAPRLLRVSTTPVAGASFIGGTTTKLRYVERATGYVIDIDPKTGEPTRITNTLTPRVYEALVGESDVILQRTIQEDFVITLSGKISTTTEGGLRQLRGVNLGNNVSDVHMLPGTTDIVMMMQTATGSQVVRSSWEGKSPRQIASIPAGSFTLSAPSAANIYMTERAASGIPGSMYRAGTALTPILRNLPGLSTAPHASGALIYSTDNGEELSLYIRSSSSSAQQLPLSTTADKCVWAMPSTSLRAFCAVPDSKPGPRFTDEWYKGTVHTDDTWYEITLGGTPRVVFTTDTMTAFDVENPVIDATGTYLAFTNALDKSLWLLRIAE